MKINKFNLAFWIIALSINISFLTASYILQRGLTSLFTSFIIIICSIGIVMSIDNEEDEK